MAIVVNGSCLCNRGGDFAIESYPDGGWYLIRPLGDRIDDLLDPLEELGMEWISSEWAFYCPSACFGGFRRFVFLNGLRIARRSA